MAGGCNIFSKLFFLLMCLKTVSNVLAVFYLSIVPGVPALSSIEYSAVHKLLQIRGHIWILPPPGNLVIFVGKFFECLKRKVAGFLGCFQECCVEENIVVHCSGCTIHYIIAEVQYRTARAVASWSRSWHQCYRTETENSVL